jgi:uncharacterized membrane protein
MKPWLLGTAAGIATGTGVALASRGPTLVAWPAKVRTAFPFALGGLVGVTTAVTCDVVASTVQASRGRGHGPGVTLGLVTAGAALAAVGGTIAARRVLSQLGASGRELDTAFATPPADPLVSGGPGSLVSVDELGREGARFVGTVTSPQSIESVTGKKPVAQPVRVFIGVDAASTPEQRVGLALAELRRTGAFDRAYLIIQAPAGSGYANATPIDVTEVLALGDCASVVIGYGVLPSFLSLGKVATGAHTQRLLLDAVHDELKLRERKPRILLYGESLGAKVQEAAIASGTPDLDYYGVHAALWVGTPGGRVADEFHANVATESFTVDRPEQLPQPMPTLKPRVWFLEHDGDPVVRFRPKLIAERPAWLPLDGSRGRNIPEAMTWKPGITWAESFVDTMFATRMKPGDFMSLGHDYRADLGPVVTAAFGLPTDDATAARLEDFLRATEVARAERINGTS